MATKTIIFRPEFEEKLKKLKIKTKFVKYWKANKQTNTADSKYCREHALNATDWKRFIIWAFSWELTEEGYDYWDEIYHS